MSNGHLVLLIVFNLLHHDLGKIPWAYEMTQSARTIINFILNCCLSLSVYRKPISQVNFKACQS